MAGSNGAVVGRMSRQTVGELAAGDPTCLRLSESQHGQGNVWRGSLRWSRPVSISRYARRPPGSGLERKTSLLERQPAHLDLRQVIRTETHLSGQAEVVVARERPACR